MKTHQSFETARIMPQYYCPADRNFIRDLLSRVDPVTRVRIAEQYSATYLEEYKRETEIQKKENTARRRTNTRLREFVDRYKTKNTFLFQQEAGKC